VILRGLLKIINIKDTGQATALGDCADKREMRSYAELFIGQGKLR